MTSLKLAGLLCSRLCHDLAGPIGALQNGIELLSEDDDLALREQALDLVAMASTQAGRKLHFYRLVFGAGLGGGEQVASSECRTALSDLLEGGRVTVRWDLPQADWPRTYGRLVLALTLLAAHALPRGGRLTVAQGSDAGGGIAVSCEGGGARLEGATPILVRGQGSVEDAATPNEAVACLAGELSRECGLPVAIDEAPDRFTFLLRDG